MQGKGKVVRSGEQRVKRRRQIRNWSIVAVAVIVAAVGLGLFSRIGYKAEISATLLPCYAHQDVTPFGTGMLYYDGLSIHCVTTTGSIRWTYQVGTNAKFSVSDDHVVVWHDSQLYILDSNGRPSYNENMEGAVQFARIGGSYCAVVVGGETAPTLLVKDLRGTQVDFESEAFDGMMMLDMGFYGENSQYLWTLAMDIYGPAVSTVMNIFQVGRMNAGVVSLGEDLVYRVLYDNGKLRVFTTQQMYSYDYKGVQDVNSTMLVHGWQLIDWDVPDRGDAYMLLARTSQTSTVNAITELRILSGSTDRNYSLSSECVGAAVQGGSLYAVGSEYLYYTNVLSQHFNDYRIPLPEGKTVTNFLGLTGGCALVASGDEVYSVSLPK